MTVPLAGIIRALRAVCFGETALPARVSDGSSADGCGFIDSCPDFGHVADEVVAHRYKRGYLGVVQLSFALGRDVSTSGSPLRLADAVLKHETLEPGILRVEPNPGVTVEVLACVEVATGEILV